MKKNALMLVSIISAVSMVTACSFPKIPVDFIEKDDAKESVTQEGLTEEEAIAMQEAGIIVEQAPVEDTQVDVPSEISKEEVEGMIDSSKEQLGWDGEYKGAGVNVVISGADSGSPYVDFNDNEMHNASLDEAYISGNTITGVYRITTEMYASEGDAAYDLPEQEWNLTLVKDGNTIYYSRTTVLTWYNENPDGTYGHTVEKNYSTVLSKVITTEN